MKNAMLALAVCVALSPLRALAIPPGPPCHLHLVGRFISAPHFDYDMTVAVRLTVLSVTEGYPELSGRMRCTSPDKNACFLADGTFSAFLSPHPDRNLIGFKTHFTVARRDSADVCELEAVTGYFGGGSFGALLGTFACPPDGLVPVSGNFGWTVKAYRCPGR